MRYCIEEKMHQNKRFNNEICESSANEQPRFRLSDWKKYFILLGVRLLLLCHAVKSKFI